MAVKALAVNPNTQDRVIKVLDEIIEAADMKNKFFFKIVFDQNKVVKESNKSKKN